MSWVLILTVFYAGESVHIDHIDGFANQQACIAAGKAWREGFLAPHQSSAAWVDDHAFAVCVQQ
jgi:hypothetical protein